MNKHPEDLQLEAKLVGPNRFNVAARWRGELVHIDEISPRLAVHRERFVTAVVQILPQAKTTELNAELLKLADQITPDAAITELDVSKLVRPEQFFTPEIAGVAVPVVSTGTTGPTASWKLYMRWHDGKRQARDLTLSLELHSGQRVWLHPQPAPPSPTTQSGWSLSGRVSWLKGDAAPNPAELFQKICERISYLLDFPEETAQETTATLALFCMLTYVFRAWSAVPYLYVGGPMASGKTRLLEIMVRLVFRPLLSSNLTAPALFRSLHEQGNTLIYDEAESLRQSKPDTLEMMSMLLAGYKRGGQARRLVGDTFRPIDFDEYGPKVLASIGGLPPTLLSRSIPITMFRASGDSPKPKRRIDEGDYWQKLRDGLFYFALENGSEMLQLAANMDVCPSGISGRNQELWQPLLALAKWIETHGATGLLDRMQKHALVSTEATKDDAIPEADEILLTILAEAVKAAAWLTPGDILAKAQELDPNSFGRPEGRGSGPRWQANGVSRRLKNYGITPTKSNGKRLYRAVSLATLYQIQRNYGIDLGIENPGPIPPKPPTLTDPADPSTDSGGASGSLDY